MDLNMKVEVWGGNQNAPEKIVAVSFPGNEFRVHLSDGERAVGYLTIFRSNEPKADESPVMIEFVPDPVNTNELSVQRKKK